MYGRLMAERKNSMSKVSHIPVVTISLLLDSPYLGLLSDTLHCDLCVALFLMVRTEILNTYNKMPLNVSQF